MTPGIRTTPRRCGDDGSTLVLVPAGTLIVLLLGAIAVDHSALFLAKRDLLDAAAAVANDAAGAGVDPDTIRHGTNGELDPDRVANAAAISLLAQDVDGLDPAATVVITHTNPALVEVTLVADARPIFGLGPGAHTVRITAHATATGHTR